MTNIITFVGYLAFAFGGLIVLTWLMERAIVRTFEHLQLWSVLLAFGRERFRLRRAAKAAIKEAFTQEKSETPP